MNRSTHSLAVLALSITIVIVTAVALRGQETARPQILPSGIHIGERLTYNISFQRYDNVGYAEICAVSRGRLGDADAIELRMKIKTSGLLSAAFFQIDQSRTTYASVESGTPVMVRRQDNSGVTVRETVSNYLTSPASGLDFLTLLYKARQQSGAGSFILSEGERSYSVTFQPQGGERVRTDAGDFDTLISGVQSDYLTESGIQNLRVNLSSDDAHVPVLVRFKTSKGDLRISLSSIQLTEAEPDPAPTPVQTPTPKATPRPAPTPAPYVDNEPLPAELGFALGENLTYKISAGGRSLAEVSLQAKERKQFSGEDRLLLLATVTSAEPGNGIFSVGDSMRVQVNPETLAPRELSVKLSGPLAYLNGNAQFELKTGAITPTGSSRVDAPIGTHSLLSLLYAIRSFNLKPSKVISNPVNDTRVAVFWEGRAYIFTLRPSEPDTITLNGQKVSAQQIAITTGVSRLDQLGLKLWLGTDESRVPLRITLGAYQADLISESKNTPK